GRGVAREDVEDGLAVARSAAGRENMSEHDLAPAVMRRRAEDESTALARTVDRPSGEAARHLADVGLRVAAVDAHRVELEELARVVLIGAARRPLRGRTGASG